MTRVLVLTGGRIGKRMSGPGLRAWNIARVLAGAGHDVVLVTTGGAEAVESPVPVHHLDAGDERGFRLRERDADVIVFQGVATREFRSLRRSRRILVADLYDPMHLEQAEQTQALALDHADREVRRAAWTVDEQLTSADFILCASQRQRSFYLGHLAALGRIVPSTYRGDEDLLRLIAIAPYGMESRPPRWKQPAIRGVVPGIGADDKVVIWSGGIWEWFDPETLIEATAELAARRPSIRLLFQGTAAPGTPEMPVVGRARDRARELGQLDRTVFFNDGWVEWGKRQNYLLEADAGVSTHHLHLETEFAFRTRVLDYLWAGLPMVLTRGDDLATFTERHELGVVVPPNDPHVLADALERVLFDEEFARACRERIAAVRATFSWERVLEPLVAFVDAPRYAADRPGGRRRDPVAAVRGLRPEPSWRPAALAVRGADVLRRDGARGLLRRLARRAAP